MTPAERTRKWRADNPERSAALIKRQQLNRTPEQRRAESLKRNYKMTPEDVSNMLTAQGGGCAICGHTSAVRNGSKHRQWSWHIDHDHSCCPTGRTCGSCVRGVLCGRCNRALGGFEDSPELLKRALEYVARDIG